MIEELKGAGLSREEAETFLDLHTNGESQTGKICSRTNIPSSHIYSVLQSLLEKGLVNYRIINNTKTYRASKPEALVHLFEEKEKYLKKEKENLLLSISKLKTLPSELDRFTDFKFFHGIRGIKSLYAEIVEFWKKGDEYCVASAPGKSFEKLEAFFLEEVHKKRVKDKVKMRIIVNSSHRKYGKAREKMTKTEVKYLDISTNTEYGVLNDLVWLVTYGDNPYGLLIKDKNFAETYSAFFQILWREGK